MAHFVVALAVAIRGWEVFVVEAAVLLDGSEEPLSGLVDGGDQSLPCQLRKKNVLTVKLKCACRPRLGCANDLVRKWRKLISSGASMRPLKLLDDP